MDALLYRAYGTRRRCRLPAGRSSEVSELGKRSAPALVAITREGVTGTTFASLRALALSKRHGTVIRALPRGRYGLT